MAKFGERLLADIAHRAIEQAGRATLGVDDYIEGLRYIIGEIEIAINAARETS